jgi:hypothetical protein
MFNIYNFKNRNNQDGAGDLLAKKIVEKPSGFITYQDPNKDFTSQELRVSLWYLKNKSLLYKITVFVLLFLAVSLVGFSVWKWAVFIIGFPAAQRLDSGAVRFVNYTQINTRFAAQPVQVVRTQVLAGRSGSYDVMAELVNPNERFFVSFEYYFVIDGKKTETQKTFLLPAESRFVPALGIKEIGAGTPAVVLEHVEYTRISNKEIPDVVAWQQYRLNFAVSDFVFSRGLAQAGDNPDAVQFKLINNSPYNFIGADFYVVLLQTGQSVGVLPLHIDRINSLESKQVDLRNFAPNINVTEIALYPVINIYDDAVYAP